MNKIFRVIWSHSTQSWVATSELTKSKGKTKSSKTAVAAAVALAALGLAGEAAAADQRDSNKNAISAHSNTTKPNTGLDNVTVVGYDNTFKEQNAAGIKHVIVVGSNNTIGQRNKLKYDFSPVPVYNAQADGGVHKAVIVGRDNNIGRSTGINAFGTNITIRNPNTLDSGYFTVVGQDVSLPTGLKDSVIFMANGTWQGGTIDSRGNPSNLQAQFVGHVAGFALKDHEGSGGSGLVAIGQNVSTETVTGRNKNGDFGTLPITNSVVIGKDSRVGGSGSVVIGYAAHAAARQHDVLTDGALGMGSRAVAIGNLARTFDRESIAMGFTATAYQRASIALGNASKVLTTKGYDKRAEAGNNLFDGQGSVAMGDRATVLGTSSLALGQNAGVGDRASFDKASQKQGLVVEAENPNLTHALAVGGNATAASGQDVAIGGNATTSNFTINQNNDGGRQTAVGYKASAGAKEALAVGNSSKAHANTSIAIGNNARAGLADVAAANTDKGIDSVAVGNNATVEGNQSISIGKDSNVTGNSSIAVGVGNVVKGDKSGAFGDPSHITGTGTYTIGNDNGTDANPIAANNAGAFGNNNNMSAAAEGSRIVGNNNTVNVAKTFVVGNNVSASQANSVVLGADSADRAATTEASATVNGFSYSGFAGQGAADKGIVSVGAAGKERQIINVAAGNISSTSTDAINGSQLYLVMDRVEKGWVVADSATGNGLDNVRPTDRVNFLGSGPVKVTGEANTGGTVTNLTFGVDTVELTNTDGKVNTPANGAGNLVNGTNVINAINKSGWKAGGNNKGVIDTINPGDQVNFLNGTGTVASVTALPNNGGVDVKYDIDFGTLTVPASGTNKGKAQGGSPNKVASTEQVMNAINNASFFVNSGKTGSGTNSGATNVAVRAGDEVKFIAGDNIDIKQSGKEFTISAKLPTGGGAAAGGGSTPYLAARGMTAFDMSSTQKKPVTIGGDGLNANAATGVVADRYISVSSDPTSKSLSIKPKIMGSPVIIQNGNPVYPTSAGAINLGDAQANNALVDYEQMAKAINNAYWRATVAEKDGGTSNSAQDPEAQVSMGNLVTFEAGTGIDLQLSGAAKKLTISAKVQTPETTELTVNNDNGTVNTPNDGDKVVNASTIATMANEMAWLLQDGGALPADTPADNQSTAAARVKNGTRVNFVDGEGVTASVAYNAGTSAFDVKVDAKTTALTEKTGNDLGKVEAPANQGDHLMNASSVANAINAAGWKVTSNVEGSGEFAANGHTKEDKLVQPGATVTLKAGKNMQIKQSGAEFTYATKDNVQFNTVQLGGDTGPKLANDNGKVNVLDGNGGQGTVSNLKNNLPETFDANNAMNPNNAPKTEAQTLPTNAKDIEDNAATVGDVLNAGFNLQNNGAAKDFVKPYDTLNFVNGGNAKAVVETDADGKVSNISVNVVGLPVQYTDAAGNPVAKVGDQFFKVNDKGEPLVNEPAIQPADLQSNMVNPAAAPNTKGDPTTLGNVKSGLNNYVAAPATLGSNEAKAKAPDLINLNTEVNGQPVSANNAATVGDLRNMGWVVSAAENTYADTVKNANEVRFIGEGVSVTGETNATTGAREIKISYTAPTTAGLTNNNANGTASVVNPTTDGDKLVNASTVAQAINEAGFIATIGTDTADFADQEGKADALVKTGEPLTLKSGKNIRLKQNGKNITVATTKDVQFENIQLGDDTGPKITNDGNNIKIGDKDGNPTAISNVKNDLAKHTPTNAPDTTKKAGDNLLNLNVGDTDPVNKQAATVENLRNMGWVVSAPGNGYAETVKNANEVEFVAAADSGLTITGETDNNKRTITVDTATWTLSEMGNTPGKIEVTAPTAANQNLTPEQAGKRLMNASSIAQAINESGFTLKTSAATGGEKDDTSSDEETINPGDVVDMVAGKNLKVKQEADGKVTYSTAENVSFSSITVGAPDAANQNNPKANAPKLSSNDNGDLVLNGANNAPVTVSNVKGNLPDTYNTDVVNKNGEPVTTEKKLPNKVEDLVNNAATVGDILNAGFNLQGNGVAKDFVKPYDTLNFVDGTGTTAVVATDANGLVSSIQVNTVMQYTDKDGNPVKVIGGKGYAPDVVVAKNGNVYPAGTLMGADGNPADPAAPQATEVTDAPQINLVNNNDRNSKKPVTLGNVKAATGTLNGDNRIDANNNFAPLDKATPIEGNVSKAINGLADLKSAPENNALTVADAKNLGWVVSATGNNYADDVRHANEVRFTGKDGVTVNGTTNTTTGVREIEISYTPVNTADLTNNNANGTASVVNPTTDGDKLVNATTVAKAINEAGFIATIGTDTADFADQDGKENALVTTGETLTLKSGKNIRLKQNGKEITVATTKDLVADDVEAKTVTLKGDAPATDAKVKTAEGPAGVKDADPAAKKTRIEYTPKNPDGTNGTPEKLATLKDGLKFKGNNDPVIAKELNETLDIIGGVTDTTAKPVSDKNTYVENVNNKLVVKFAETPEFKGVDVVNAAGNNPVKLRSDDNTPNTLVFNGANNAPVTLKNIESNLPKTFNKDALNNNGTPVTNTTQSLPNNAADLVNNAATVGDILNAGFNLQGNGETKDFVKPYDTLNFVDGGNTKAVVKTDDNGQVSNISVNVVGLPVQFTDEAGNPVVKVGDKFFRVDENGNPTNSEVLPEELQTNMINPTAKANKKGEPVALGNVKSNLKLIDEDKADDEVTPANGLLDLSDVYKADGSLNPIGNNAATVGDLANMGWVITTPVNDFNNQVRNAGVVSFIGSGMATVEGQEVDGHSVIAVHVDAQNVVNNAQHPVVYSTKDGKKVFKQPDGSFNTALDGSGDNIEPKNIIASMNTAGDQTSPMQLTNIGSSIRNDANAAKPFLENLKTAAEDANTTNNAVNVGDLHNAIQNTGFNLATKKVAGAVNNDADASTATDKRIAADDTFTLDAGDNIKVKQIDNGYEVALSKDVNLTGEGSLSVGPVTINKDGINAGDKKITNVAPAELSPTSKDAVNGSQLYAVKELAEKGWNLSVNNGQNEGKVAPGAKVDLNNKDGNIVITKDGNNVTFDLAKVVNIGGDHKVTIDGDKGTIGGLTNKTFDPNNFTSGQAASEDQLGSVYKNLNDKIEAGNLKFVGNDGTVITKKLGDTLSIEGGVKDTAATPVSDKNTYVENVNGKLVVKFAEKPEFKGVTLKDGDNNVVNMNSTAPNTLNLTGKDGTAPVSVTNVKGNLPDTYNKDALNPADKRVTEEQTLPSNAGDLVNNAATVGDILNAGWNLKENGTAKDFVKAYDTVNFVNGTGTVAKVTPNEKGTASDVTFDVKAVNGNGTIATVGAEGVKIDIKPDNTGNATNVTVGPNGLKVDVKAKDGIGTKATVEADGIKVDVKLGDNLSVNPTSGNIEIATTGLSNAANGKVNTPAANEGGKLVNATTVANAINNSGFTLKTSGTTTTPDVKEVIKPGATVDMAAGKNMTVAQSANGTVTYATKDDVEFSSVKVGDVNINADGINAGNKVISNVAPGEKPTDAVNVSQLKGAVNHVANHLGNKINRQGKDLRAGIAGANAAAGLPQVYIPGKSMVAASAGTFKGQSAVAVGYSRASDNGKLILKLQGNANTRGDVGGSVGIGYQW